MRCRHQWLALALMVGFQSTAAWAQQLTPEQQKIQELEQQGRGTKPAPAGCRGQDRRRSGAKGCGGSGSPVLAPAPPAQTGSQRPTNAGVAAGTIPATEANSVGLVTVGPSGFGIQSGDGNFLLKIGADVQTDLRTLTGTGSSALLDQILLRRVRPTFSGTVYKYIDYFVRPDFGQGSVIIYDVYAQLNYIPHFAIRVGKFKPPVGLERLQSDDDTTFIERGLPTLLAPSRAIGFQIAGDIIDHRLGYQLGVFSPVPDNSLADTSPSNGRDYTARLFAAPFQPNENFLSGLGFGVAAQGGSVDGIALPAYKTVGQNTFFAFASGVTSAGHRTTVAPQAFYYVGPFGLLAEDTVTEEEFQKATTMATTRRDVAFRAWQVEASYVLTGEKKSFGSPNPKHPFAPFNHGWGAWEIAARTGDFRVDQGLFAAGFATLSTSPGFAREWVGGVNWYLKRILRISMDYGHTNFLGGAVNADRAAERVILARFQINFI